jgi:hypothetical protein
MTSQPKKSKALHITLWVMQTLLAIMLIWAGFTKLFEPMEKLSAMWPWTGQVPIVGRPGINTSIVTSYKTYTYTGSCYRSVCAHGMRYHFSCSEGRGIANRIKYSLYRYICFCCMGTFNKSIYSS